MKSLSMLASLTPWRRGAARIRHASWADRRLMAETVLWLGLGRLSVLIVPSQWLLRRLGRPRYETPADDDPRLADAAQRIGFVIRFIGPHTPWRSNCLAQALAAHGMLRCRRIPSTLYLGVTTESGRLEAHAFLRSGRTVITGGGDHERYTWVAGFGWTP